MIEHQMHCRFVKFYRALCTSRKKWIIKCCELIRNGSNSPVSNSLSHVAHYFHTNRLNLQDFDVTTFEPLYSDLDICLSIAIEDLLNMRNSNILGQTTFFSIAECDFMFQELCVSWTSFCFSFFLFFFPFFLSFPPSFFFLCVTNILFSLLNE